jgi:hypothetical protein
MTYPGFGGIRRSIAVEKNGRAAFAAVDRAYRGEYITPSTGRGVLCLAVWCSRQAMGSTGLAGSPVAAERVKSIGWAASLSHDGVAGSLTIWFEEREAWTARSLRAPFRVSALGDAVNETSAVLRIL